MIIIIITIIVVRITGGTGLLPPLSGLLELIDLSWFWATGFVYVLKMVMFENDLW